MSLTKCQTSAALNYHINTENEETLIDDLADTIGHVKWIFEESVTYNFQVLISLSCNKKRLHKRFGVYKWDNNTSEGFQEYLTKCCSYIYNKMREGKVTNCEVMLNMYDVPVFIHVQHMQRLATLIIENDCVQKNVFDINHMLRMKYKQELTDMLQATEKLTDEHNASEALKNEKQRA